MRALANNRVTTVYIPLGLVLIAILTYLLESLQTRARAEVIEMFRR